MSFKKGCNILSIIHDKQSIGLLHAETIGRIGMPILCNLGKPYKTGVLLLFNKLYIIISSFIDDFFKIGFAIFNILFRMKFYPYG